MMRRMRARRLHPWRVSYEQALAIQQRLRPRVRRAPLPQRVRLVAAADVAYSQPTHRMYASVVVCRLPALEVVETAQAVCRARFPYIPGLFSFREIPPLLAAFARLRAWPDVLLFDGQGLAHPRRFGLACHAGLLLNRPSLGCAKSLLVGEHGEVPRARGGRAPLVHEGEVIGLALRTREAVSPIFLSVGHRADLASAVDLVLALTPRFRLPEPLRLAHQHTRMLMRRHDARAPIAKRRDYPDLVA
jgi:deoxyribonuclease V